MARLIVDFPPGRSYAPEDDGWIALIEESDVDRVLTEIWSDWKLEDVEWEGIYYQDRFWRAIYLADNEKGFVLVIPDALGSVTSLGRVSGSIARPDPKPKPSRRQP